MLDYTHAVEILYTIAVKNKVYKNEKEHTVYGT